MEPTVKRAERPKQSENGEHVLDQYEQWFRTEEDLTSVTIRTYLSGLCQFAVWCESIWKHRCEEGSPFTPEAMTTPTLINYRTYLQKVLCLKPNSVNRSLISLERYFAWLLATRQMKYNPAKVIKQVEEEVSSPLHLYEQALVAVVMESGTFSALGKPYKHREISLNATARAALLVYDSSLQISSHDTTPLFLSEKRHSQLTEQELGHLIKTCTAQSYIADLSHHDLRHRFGYCMAETVPLHR